MLKLFMIGNQNKKNQLLLVGIGSPFEVCSGYRKTLLNTEPLNERSARLKLPHCVTSSACSSILVMLQS